MKRYTFVIAMLLGAAISLNAQTVIKPSIGLDIARLTDDPGNFESDFRPGFHVGGTILVGEQFYFQPGIYFMRYSNELVSADDENITVDYSVNNLLIPVHVGFHLLERGETEIFNIRLFGGLNGIFPLSVQSNEDPDVTYEPDNLNDMHLQLEGGVGVDILFLFVEGSYQAGITDYYDDDETLFDSDAKFNNFRLDVGLRLKI